MRIKLETGKQRELIEHAKQKKKWDELAGILGISPSYLRNELRYEQRLLSGKIYHKLSAITRINYDPFILQKLSNSWGQSKGGLNARDKNIKSISLPKHSSSLAEAIGIILGDGNLTKISSGKIGTYELRITGDSRYDLTYYQFFVKPLFDKLFSANAKIVFTSKGNSVRLRIYRKLVISYFQSHGLLPGNKISNQTTIPCWIRENPIFLRACLRGLYDTDGGAYRLRGNTYQIVFTNYNQTLMNDVRESLISLGIHPSHITKRHKLYITKKSELKSFLKQVGFRNHRHLKKVQSWTQYSPVV